MENTATQRPVSPLSTDFTPQRRHPRIPFEVEVTLESDHNFFTGFTQNISEGGLFVATSRLRPVGTVIAFTFRLDAFPEPVACYGVVRWVRESTHFTDDQPAGMGIQFTQIPAPVANHINQFIRRQRDTIFYDD